MFYMHIHKTTIYPSEIYKQGQTAVDAAIQASGKRATGFRPPDRDCDLYLSPVDLKPGWGYPGWPLHQPRIILEPFHDNHEFTYCLRPKAVYGADYEAKLRLGYGERVAAFRIPRKGDLYVSATAFIVMEACGSDEGYDYPRLIVVKEASIWE